MQRFVQSSRVPFAFRKQCLPTFDIGIHQHHCNSYFQLEGDYDVPCDYSKAPQPMTIFHFQKWQKTTLEHISKNVAGFAFWSNNRTTALVPFVQSCAVSRFVQFSTNKVVFAICIMAEMQHIVVAMFANMLKVSRHHTKLPKL